MKSIPLARIEPKHSPAVVTLFAGAFISATSGKIVEKLWKMAEERVSRNRTIYEALEHILDPAEDTQFLLGERWGKVVPKDRDTGLCFLENIPIHGGNPKVQLKPNPSPKELDSHLYLIGNPVANPVTGIFTGNISIEEASALGINTKNLQIERLVNLPFTFCLDVDPEAHDKPVSKIADIPQKTPPTPPLNFVIKSRSNGRIYSPRYSFDEKYYDRDYLMFAKLPNIHISGVTRGTKCVIIAGCHSIGTSAAQRLLAKTKASREILEDLRKKVGTNDFQAIFHVSKHPAEEPEEIIEIELFRLEII